MILYGIFEIGKAKTARSPLPDVKMIDFHCHLLPGIDDGSKSVGESLEMLREMKCQGMAAVVATPHYIAEDEYPDGFLRRRAEAEMALEKVICDDGFPAIYSGAEVFYFRGMGRTRELEKLCISGTKYMLVEMPPEEWDEHVIDDISDIRSVLGLYPIIAHIERYLSPANEKMLNPLADAGAIFQSNAEFFIEKRTRKKAMDFFGKSEILLLGSDAHGANARRPNLREGLEYINDRFGDEALENLCKYGEKIICDALPICRSHGAAATDNP